MYLYVDIYIELYVRQTKEKKMRFNHSWRFYNRIIKRPVTTQYQMSDPLVHMNNKTTYIKEENPNVI